MEEVVDEAMKLFGGDTHIGVLVSIGAAHPGLLTLPKHGIRRIFPVSSTGALKIAVDAQNVAASLSRKYPPDIYFRFNATYGLGQVTLDEWKGTRDAIDLVQLYLHDSHVSRGVDVVVERLCGLHSDHKLAEL
jgi:hypothetical protein